MWHEVSIGDSCDILDSQRIPLNAEERYLIPGSYPYYGANGVQGYIGKYIFDDKLILMAEDGGYFDEYDKRPIAYQVSGKFWVNNHAHILKAKDGFDQDFVFYSLVHKNIMPVIKGGTRSKLNQSELKEILIKAPVCKSLQQKISRILTKTDDAIEKTQALIAKYENIKQGMMQDLFSRGVDENGQLRPSYEDAPHLYQETELGWIPNDWAVERLDNLAEIDRGKFTHRPRNDPRMYGGEYPFIQTSDVTASNGGEIATFNQTLSKAGTRVSKSFPRGTIAVTIAANIADTGFLGREMYFPDSVVGVQVSDANNRHFVELCIRMNKQQLDALAPQSAQKNINLEDLRPMLVPRPSPDEQKAIADRYRAITSKIESEKLVLAKLRKTKLGLMYDLLTGTVRVAEDMDERKEAVA